MQTRSRLQDKLTQARACLAGGYPGEAARHCQGVLEIEPANVAALAILAESARRMGDFETAVPPLQALARLTPEQAGVLRSLGSALARLQRDAEAIDAYEKCIALDNNNGEALRGLGNAFARSGRRKRASELMQRVIALNPRDTAAHYQLTTLITAEPDDPRVNQLKSLYSDADFSAREHSRLAFALARILDQQGNFDEAFEWFRTANSLRRQEGDFDAGADEAWIERAMTTFNAHFLARHASSGIASSKPVFIVGLPRSGSTLLEQVLASHAEVHGAGELMLLPATLAGLSSWLPPGEQLPEAVAKIEPGAWLELGRDYLAKLDLLAPAASRIVDKQLFNYTLVGFIRLILPEARILHTSRHPMATCWSCYATAFRNDRGFTHDLGDLGRTWRLYRKIMDHWHALLPDQLLEVRYEDMLDDLEGTVRKVLRFLDLPWDDACLEFHKTERTVATASKTQVRQPLYAGSREHWRNYEAHLEPLRSAMQAPQK